MTIPQVSAKRPSKWRTDARGPSKRNFGDDAFHIEGAKSPGDTERRGLQRMSLNLSSALGYEGCLSDGKTRKRGEGKRRKEGGGERPDA